MVDDSKQGIVEHENEPSSVEEKSEVKVQETEGKAIDEDIYVECVDVTCAELLEEPVMILDEFSIAASVCGQSSDEVLVPIQNEI